MTSMFDSASGLSDENKCAIHKTFSSNENWVYDWKSYCPEPEPSTCPLYMTLPPGNDFFYSFTPLTSGNMIFEFSGYNEDNESTYFNFGSGGTPVAWNWEIDIFIRSSGTIIDSGPIDDGSGDSTWVEINGVPGFFDYKLEIYDIGVAGGQEQKHYINGDHVLTTNLYIQGIAGNNLYANENLTYYNNISIIHNEIPILDLNLETYAMNEGELITSIASFPYVEWDVGLSGLNSTLSRPYLDCPEPEPEPEPVNAFTLNFTAGQNIQWEISGRYTSTQYNGIGNDVLNLPNDIYKFKKIGDNWANASVTLIDISNETIIFETIGSIDSIFEFSIGKLKCYTFRLQPALWDFGGNVGEQWTLPFHQYIDVNGFVLTPGEPGGSWQPFLPGPTILGHIGDIICVTIQNRIEDSDGHFIDSLEHTSIVHWHGIEVSNCFDGTPVTQVPIPANTDFTYKFQLVRPGLFWYHPHWDSMIQNPLGANGAIICDDDISKSLRSNNIIPHENRTFVISMSDISFQSDRGVATGSNHVDVYNVSPYSEDDPDNAFYIRNIMPIGGGDMDQNFGDVILINGKYNIPFNDPSGNTQQFWHEGIRDQTEPVKLRAGESVALYVTNNGMHRFYKIHLDYTINTNADYTQIPDVDWESYDNLVRLGGEGGLLDEAKEITGSFGDWKIRGIRQRRHPDEDDGSGTATATGTGLQQPQTATELESGEFLLPTAARQFVAFDVDKNNDAWTYVALRASGFSVQNQSDNTDSDPDNWIIAIFAIESGSPDPDYVLANNMEAATKLRTNPILGALASPLTDLSIIPAADVETYFTNTTADLSAADVMVPVSTAAIMQDYDITLTGLAGPGQNGVSVHFDHLGPYQVTYDNTRYIHAGETIEWTVETQTASADHPWHMHGFSFQPIKMELNQGPDLTTGIDQYILLYEWNYVEYLDVMYVPAYHKLTYRFVVEDRPFIDTNDILYPGGVYGRWLAHCHIFKHAHKGMMMEFIVVNANNSLTDRRFPTDIYLRDNTTDDGTVPSSGAISASPDIILSQILYADPNAEFGEGSTGADSATLGYEAEYGQHNYIYVRVKNRSFDINDATNVTTDVYWSEVSTLITPDQWSYIGTTNPVDVPTGDTLVVADPITWSSVPAPGHYCLVGVTGNPNDPKTLTKSEVTNFIASGMTWTEFYDLIRNNNNVTWRNFNVIDVNPKNPVLNPVLQGPYEFKFKGAFDADRIFDLKIVHSFDSIEWKIPKADEYNDQLELELNKYSTNELTYNIDANNYIIQINAQTIQLKSLLLSKNQSYESSVIVNHTSNVINKEFYVSQLYDFSENDLFEVGRVTWKYVEQRHDIRRRKEINTLTNVERAHYINTYIELWNDDVNELQTLVNNHTRFFSRGLHNNGAFLPWHRGFLLKVENILRDKEYQIYNTRTITIPYWNWSLNQNIIDSTIWGNGPHQFSGDGNGENNDDKVLEGPFGCNNGFTLTNGNCLQRRISGGSASQAEIDKLFTEFPNADNYDAFRNRLEHGPGLHDTVHCLVGGTMCSVTDSSQPWVWEQSTLQAFYLFLNIQVEDVTGETRDLTSKDKIGAFRMVDGTEVCVGSIQGVPGNTNVPVMGDDGSDITQYYMQNGDIPTFKLYDPETNQVLSSSVEVPGWTNLGINKIDTITFDGLARSSNDPVFFLHHAHIDKIWNDWQGLSLDHMNAYDCGDCPDLPDFMPAEMLDNNNLPNNVQVIYDYDDLIVDTGMLVPGFTFHLNNYQGYNEYKHDATGIKFIYLPGGTFEMGSPNDEQGHENDETLHSVTLSPFLIAKYEITQDQWSAVTGGTVIGNENNPVDNVSWTTLHGSDGFLARTGLSLPSEAQWEYACRAGQSGLYSGTGNLDEMAWYLGNSDNLHQIGTKKANQFGLHDMHGNVWEWCEDEYNEYFYTTDGASSLNPLNTGDGDKVVRGGSWKSSAVDCRSANRNSKSNADVQETGFRPVKLLSAPLYYWTEAGVIASPNDISSAQINNPYELINTGDYPGFSTPSDFVNNDPPYWSTTVPKTVVYDGDTIKINLLNDSISHDQLSQPLYGSLLYNDQSTLIYTPKSEYNVINIPMRNNNGQAEYGTILYDSYPTQDADFNDLVIRYNIRLFKQSTAAGTQGIKSIIYTIVPAAYGAKKLLGVGLEIDGFSSDNLPVIEKTIMLSEHNGPTELILDSNRSNLSWKLFNNFRNAFAGVTNANLSSLNHTINTNLNGYIAGSSEYQVHIIFNDLVDLNLNDSNIKLFIYDREREYHLNDYAATDDNLNLPYILQASYAIAWPLEQNSIIDLYPNLNGWSENNSTGWYDSYSDNSEDPDYIGDQIRYTVPVNTNQYYDYFSFDYNNQVGTAIINIESFIDWEEPEAEPETEPGPVVAEIRIRKEITALSHAERVRYITIFKKAMESTNTTMLRHHVDMHRTLFSQGLHNNGAFLPWHRWCLLQIENSLRETEFDEYGERTITIPYWNWSLHQQINSSSFLGLANDQFSADGNGNNNDNVMDGEFGSNNGYTKINGSALQRNFSNGNAASTTTVDNLMTMYPNYTQYDNFRNRLEHGPGLHDSVHNIIGGTMASSRATNDPLFFSHHANVDRIWSVWQELSYDHKYAYTGTTSLMSNMVGTTNMGMQGTTPQDMLNMEYLKNYYDSSNHNRIHVIYEI